MYQRPENLNEIQENNIFSTLHDRRRRSKEGGGKKRIENQHKKGKLTARERIELLVDENSFNEIDSFVTHQSTKFDMAGTKPYGDGVVTGHAKISGRTIYVYSQDFTVFGGSLGRAQATKICKVMDLAIKTGNPIIGLLDSGGARIQEGVASLAGYGDIFYRNTQASGVIPQISVILGPCAGGAVYSPALTDFVLMNKENSFMFVTGPEVVKAVTGEEISFYDLGGSNVHSSITGVCHLVGETEEDTLDLVRKLMAYLPSNNLNDTPSDQHLLDVNTQQNLRELIPAEEDEPYDMKSILGIIVDSDSFLELQEDWAKNIIIGFSRLNGSTVGIVANQPLYLGGAIDFNAADKASRFIRFCDSFNIPILTFVDVPGFLPGIKQEHEGIIRHGAKLLFAYSEATVPKISVIVRKAYGGAYIVMSSKHLGTDVNLAWPTAQIAVMGSEGACRILYRSKLIGVDNPEQILKEFTEKFKEEFANPYQAAELGYVDKVIFPEETRNEIIVSLSILRNKREQTPRRKHGIFPV
ncbi:MAG: acyl-CoA carboxylase subunit beta [Candidatus Heimdallarchaeota archaeon]|nr:acyl-CoA carboxylase subunit beta [Candidatus Heimdallarchaeota archaeon]